jgi:hypothetical protein
MAFVGLLTALGFSLLGLPLPLGLGLIAGLFTFVEYVGAILSAIPAVFVALPKGLLFTSWVALLYTVVHVIEGYVLTSLITVHFPPAFTLAVQLLFASLFAFSGSRSLRRSPWSASSSFACSTWKTSSVRESAAASGAPDPANRQVPREACGA